MALLHVDFHSNALEMTTSFIAILPEEGALAEKKVVYLLHGLEDNCTGWSRYTACERYARERDLAVIMPEVQRSFYTDCVYGPRYFTYVSQELPAAIRRMFGLSGARDKNYIMGLSMGGYGALKCALTYPEQYAGCGSFSGVTDLAGYRDMPVKALRDRDLTAMLGPEHTVGPENDLFALAARGKGLPSIYLSCGEEDALYPMNRRFCAHLGALGIAHRFDHRPGTHSWDFWDKSLADCMTVFFD